METELQLYINQEDYMVADVVLLKKDKLTGEVLDALLIENKLSPSTKLTPRQKELFDLLRNSQDGIVCIVRGEERILRGTPPELYISKDNIIKIVGDRSNPSTTITIEKYK